jgi:raffinose/stachyose/melibiose transport system permease protein
MSSRSIQSLASLDDVGRPHSVGRSIGRAVLSVVSNGILWLFCLSYLFPFLWMLYNTLKTQPKFILNIFNLPIPPVWSNWRDIFSFTDTYSALINSTYNTALSMLLIVGLSFTVGYFLSRYTFPGRNFIYGFFLVGMLVPIMALLVPVYIQFNKLGMVNHRYTLLIPYVAFSLPQAIYLYDSYLRGIPRAIEEAAFVDGATTTQIMTTIIFPMCMPITGTILILNFLGLWNEFPFALVLVSGMGHRTVPVWLTTFQGQYTSQITMRITAMVIAMAPIIIAYFFLRDKMMEGLTAGAIKG